MLYSNSISMKKIIKKHISPHPQGLVLDIKLIRFYLAIIIDIVGDTLENSLVDRAIYKDSTRLIKTINNSRLYTTYVVNLNKLLY